MVGVRAVVLKLSSGPMSGRSPGRCRQRRLRHGGLHPHLLRSDHRRLHRHPGRRPGERRPKEASTCRSTGPARLRRPRRPPARSPGGPTPSTTPSPTGRSCRSASTTRSCPTIRSFGTVSCCRTPGGATSPGRWRRCRPLDTGRVAVRQPYSLLRPDTAARVRAAFPVLGSPAGLAVEATVCAQLL